MTAQSRQVLLYGGIFSGASDDGDLLMEFFLRAQGIPYRRVTDRDMAEMGFTDDYGLFLVPAGHYFEPTPEWAFGGETARARLREAIVAGMSYYGVCSGALIATPVCVRPSAISLGLTQARPRWGGDPGIGTQFFTVRLTPRLARLAGLDGEYTRVWYHNGPVLQRTRESLYRTLATFEPTPEERAQTRGMPLFGKRLRGAPAIAELRYGRGRVVLCAPHFEYGDESVRDYLARIRGWLDNDCPDTAEGDPGAPERLGRRVFLDTLGGERMAPVRKSTNWRVLAALISDLRSGTPPAPARSR
jgi:hypothetical protein